MTPIAVATGQAPKYSLEIGDIIKDFNGRPHRMIKMKVTGPNFPHRAVPPFVRIVNGLQKEESWFTEVANDNRSITGHFPIDASLAGDVEVGYANEVMVVFKRIKWDKHLPLDVQRIEREVVTVNKEWLKKKTAEKKPGK